MPIRPNQPTPVVTPPVTTTVNATTTTTPVAPVTTPPVNTTPVGNPNATGVTQTPVRNVAGLPPGFAAGSGADQGMTGAYAPRPTSSYFVGYGDITKLTPTQDGFKVDLNIYTSGAQDKVQLFLQLPVLDKKTGALTYLNLDLLTHDGAGKFDDHVSTAALTDPISTKSCFGGTRSYSFSLDQINSFLKTSGLNLQVKPGDQMSISGMVVGSNHRVMNAASNSFAVPQPTVKGGQIIKPGQAAAAHQTAIKAQDLPLDISIKLPKTILDEQIYVGSSYMKASDVLEGDITTRLESEFKGSVTATQMDSMITSSYALAELSELAEGGDKKARKKLDALLGKDLILSPVKRHWMTSDGDPVGERDPKNLGNDKNGQPLTIPKDAKGWPSLDPMKDGYSDDKKLTFSNNSGAARTRGNKQKMGHAEFKLNGGVLDPKTGIRQRVEIGLSLKPGADDAKLKALLKFVSDNPASKLAQSPLGHIIEDARKAGVLDAVVGDRTPWADVTQIRHKFELKNTKTGTSAELSLDMVHAQTVRPEHEVNGKPQEQTYYVIEAELDHLQINSSNVTEMVDSTSKAALTSTAAQETWIKSTVAGLAAGTADLMVMNKPQLHSVEHVKEGSFRQTPSYKDYEGMQENLLVAICDNFKPGPARQKSAHFAELLGLVPPEQTVTT
ncbi:MAG: hypothetical protein Q8O67_13830 [Deltaproteobacteria bacterium]|nr:hypothetical protein [Deltaproteobacteria bacterium]